MKLDSIFLAGVGVCMPGHLSVEDAKHQGIEGAADREKDGWTGVAVAGDIPAPDLAVAAGRDALRESGCAPADIGLLIHADTFHQGPDIWSPQSYIQRKTVGGCAPAIELRQGCCGMIAGIELAACFLLAERGRTEALITGADNFGTPLNDRWNYGAGLGRGSLYGDAGAALVVSRRSGFARVLAVNTSSLPEYEELYRGTIPLFPPGCTVGRRVVLTDRGQSRAGAELAGYIREVAADVGRARCELAAKTLDDAELQPSDITRVTHVFAGHESYVRHVLEPLGIDPKRGMLEFGRGIGHLSVCDHVVALDHLRRTGAVQRGDRVLMIANGVGVSLAALVLEIGSPGSA